MIRRILPALALASLLGACSSGTTNAPEPGAPTPSRTGVDGRPDGRPDGRMDGRGDRDGRRGGGREEMLLRGITLTADQQRRIDSIRTTWREQNQRDRQAGTMDRDAMRERMERQQREIRAVLTTEQQAQFDRNVAELRERMQQGGGRRPNR